MYNLLFASTVLTAIVMLLATFYNLNYVQTWTEGPIVSEIFAQGPENDTNRENTSSTMSSNMSTSSSNESSTLTGELLSGNFVGAGDGIHNAEGVAKAISIDGDRRVLRVENLKVTNGPDLYVYLATDKSGFDFVDLGRLKGNIGNQNYDIPASTDLTKYNTMLIWCKVFSVLFGSAELTGQN